MNAKWTKSWISTILFRMYTSLHFTFSDLANAQFATMIEGWRNTNAIWITNFTGPIHFVHYHELRWNMTATMTRILHFLDWEVTVEQLQCVEKHSEGKFHRIRPETLVPNIHYFYPQNARTLQKYKKEIYGMVHNRTNSGYYLINETKL